MTNKFFFFISASLFFGVHVAEGQNDLKLWYDKPAGVWTEALPLGNGRLGAMVFGRVNEELLQLNEGTLWSGGPVKDNVNPGASAYLPQIRDALFNHEDYAKATALTKKMQGVYSESFLPLGNLLIRQIFPAGPTTNYRRDLDIGNAVAHTRFRRNGIQYARAVFCSAPDQVIVIRLTADRRSSINFDATSNSLLHYQHNVEGKDFVLKGNAPAHVDPSYLNSNNPVVYGDTGGCNGMRFQLRLRALSNDGAISVDTAGIHVRHATLVVLFVSMATSFNGFDKCPSSEGKDERSLATNYLQNAIRRTYPDLLQRHLADYHGYFNRVSLELHNPAAKNYALLPSDKRLSAYSEGSGDTWVERLYFQFGRYLLISCSRPGGPAANLQGIWNQELRAPWSSNYTININTQMNYWPAEETNLSEMHGPLFGLIEDLSVTGGRTAKQFYGLRGWVAHHNSDLWALSNPVGGIGGGDPKWANWTQGGNWLCRDLWEHYQFTLDKKFLQDTAYPLMKGAALFVLDFLTENKEGYLVTAPSVSPENVFKVGDSTEGEVAIAATMDMSIIRDLFSNLINASLILNQDAAFREKLMAQRSKLFPLQVGHRGNLQEWYKDFDDMEVHHRHVSHLFGLYPGTEISPAGTPAYAEAARRTLEIRGDEGTGWSKAWKINFWARLLDGDHAYRLLQDLLHATREHQTNYQEGGGTYPNFLDAHPPFQIDGNFGGTAGMTEMLLQSQSGEIFLLPAMPGAWKEGSVTGLKARGNFSVSMKWAQNRLTGASIRSLSGGVCKVRTKGPVTLSTVRAKVTKDPGGYVITFSTRKGKTYMIHPVK